MVQTAARSRLEVLLDWLLGLLTNVVAQAVLYPGLFTWQRAGPFTVVFLTLSPLRRYGTRRWANRYAGAHGQSWRASSLEVWVDTLLSYLMAVGLQLLFYGEGVSWVTLGPGTWAMYGLTFARRLGMRRLFERGERDGI